MSGGLSHVSEPLLIWDEWVLTALLELFTTLSSLTPMGYSIPISTKIHVVFLGSVSSFFHSSLCYPDVWLPQSSSLQRMGLGRTQPLRLHPWISLLPFSSQPLSPGWFTQPIPSLPAGEACAAKAIMQISQGHWSTNKHLPSQYHPLITSLSKYNSEPIWIWICFR